MLTAIPLAYPQLNSMKSLIRTTKLNSFRKMLVKLRSILLLKRLFIRCLHYARQQCQLEIKRYDRRRRLERTATLLCLWFQSICIVWIQLIQPLLNHSKEPRQTSLLPEGVVQPQKHLPQNPFHRSGILQNCITLHNPSSGLQTSGFGLRKHPFTGQLKMHNGIGLFCRSRQPLSASDAERQGDDCTIAPS